MMNAPRGALVLPLLSMPLLVASCGGDDGEDITRAQVLESYAKLVHANYAESLDTAKALQTAVDGFVAAPSEAGLEAAKTAWKAARIPYGQTEAFRFYAGPIDDDDGPEGQLNAWPLDESYIDYTESSADSGIVNDTTIEITVQRLAGLNEGAEGDIVTREGTEFDAEAAVSTGYHAVEFLLWGQDLSASGPGARPWQDYLTDANATHPNGDRRGAYLKAVSSLIVSDLESLVDEWKEGGAYRSRFLADEQGSLKNIVGAIGILSKGELAGERMDVALGTRDQEDEHSCFSDNTHIDIEMNQKGIANVFEGTYGGQTFHPSIEALLMQEDAVVGAEVAAAVAAASAAVGAIQPPFDVAVSDPSSAAWMVVDSAVKALFAQGDAIAKMGPALGLGTISVELPE